MFNMNQQMRPLGQMWPQPTGQFPLNPGMGGPMQGQQQPGQLPQMGQFPPQMSPGGGGAGAPMQPNGQFPLNPGINGGFQMPQGRQQGQMQQFRPQMHGWPQQRFGGQLPSFTGQ